MKWLEEWYCSMCDGDWEHCYGIQIDTLDNPGWRIQIDIVDTPLEEKRFETIDKYNSGKDWILCRVRDGKFDGGGDTSKLEEIIKIFRNWAETQD